MPGVRPEGVELPEVMSHLGRRDEVIGRSNKSSVDEEKRRISSNNPFLDMML